MKTLKVFVIAFILPILVFPQESSNSYISLNYGSYQFVKNGPTEIYFSDFSSIVPSITYNYSFADGFSINTKIIYLSHFSSVGDKSGSSYRAADIKEFMLFPRIEYNFVRLVDFLLATKIGAYAGYVNNYSETQYYYPYLHETQYYKSPNKYIAVGGSAGITIEYKIMSSKTLLLLNVDYHYAKPGDKSIFGERSGIIIDVGIGRLL